MAGLTVADFGFSQSNVGIVLKSYIQEQQRQSVRAFR